MAETIFTIADRYDLTECIGRCAYSGTDRVTGKRIAAKYVTSDPKAGAGIVKAGDPAFVLRRKIQPISMVTRKGNLKAPWDRLGQFSHSAQLLASLSGTRGIPECIDFVTQSIRDWGECLWLITEYVEGVPLCEYREQSETLLTERQEGTYWRSVRQILIDLLEIVNSIHSRGIVHFDIHPNNIIIGTNGAVSLIDFGSAQRLINGKAFSQTALPGFSAPEITKGDAGIDADLYSVGKVLEYMACANKGAVASTPAGKLGMLWEKATSESCEDRFRSAREMQEALSGITESDYSVFRKSLSPVTDRKGESEAVGCKNSEIVRKKEPQKNARPGILKGIFSIFRKSTNPDSRRRKEPDSGRIGESDPPFTTMQLRGFAPVAALIRLGHYPIRSEEPEPIEWFCFSLGGEAILVSRRLIACGALDETEVYSPYLGRGFVEWESSSIRKWLNEAFFPQAFTDPAIREIVIPAHSRGGLTEKYVSELVPECSRDEDNRVFLMRKTGNHGLSLREIILQADPAQQEYKDLPELAVTEIDDSNCVGAYGQNGLNLDIVGQSVWVRPAIRIQNTFSAFEVIGRSEYGWIYRHWGGQNTYEFRENP